MQIEQVRVEPSVVMDETLLFYVGLVGAAAFDFDEPPCADLFAARGVYYR